MASTSTLPSYQKVMIDYTVHMQWHLAKFLMWLLKEITDYSDAISAYNSELRYFKDLGKKHDKISQKQSKGGLAFLIYLGGYLHVAGMVKSWCDGSLKMSGQTSWQHPSNKQPSQVLQLPDQKQAFWRLLSCWVATTPQFLGPYHLTKSHAWILPGTSWLESSVKVL